MRGDWWEDNDCLLKLAVDLSSRFVLEDRDSELDVTEGAYGLLHPDHAYLAGSRRGSSQSEQLEVEPYQLNRDFSRSLPGSRRSSFQSSQNPDKGEKFLWIILNWLWIQKWE